jgi:hypothetical protein
MPRDAFQPLPIETELIAEKASALARVAAQLESALAALTAADQAIAAADPGARQPLLEKRRELREAASRQLWYVVVQREAIGLRDHESLYRLYRVPKEIRLYPGPRRS